jgi:hypothetical protein
MHLRSREENSLLLHKGAHLIGAPTMHSSVQLSPSDVVGRLKLTNNLDRHLLCGSDCIPR